jgi:hypothetical protein
MEINYRKLLKEYGIEIDKTTLEPVIIDKNNDFKVDPAFTVMVKEFEGKLKKKSLTDEEIEAADAELIKQFGELHELSEEDSPELKKEKRKARILEGKDKISEAGTIEEIEKLQAEYGDVADELQAFIDKRVEKINKAAYDQQVQQAITQGKEEIKGAAYEDLPKLAAKYADYPELVTAINARIEKEKPEPKGKTLREKLAEAKRQEWTYDQLRSIGITPTGEDMVVEGVFLERQYLLKIYKITKIDGKAV